MTAPLAERALDAFASQGGAGWRHAHARAELRQTAARASLFVLDRLGVEVDVEAWTRPTDGHIKDGDRRPQPAPRDSITTTVDGVELFFTWPKGIGPSLYARVDGGAIDGPIQNLAHLGHFLEAAQRRMQEAQS